MKKLRLFLALFTIAICFGMIGTVKAVSGSVTSSTTNHAVTISRTITGAANNVTNNFDYAITPAEDYSGVTGVPYDPSVYFSNAAPTSGSVTRTATLDFTGMTFEKNGDYIYTITELYSMNGITYPVDSTNKYTVKFFVRNASATDFSSKVVTIQLYTGQGSTATKRSGSTATTLPFTSAAVLRTITINKTVEGNMADADKYFDIDLTINGDATTAGDSYVITGQTASNPTTSCTMPSEEPTGDISCTATVKIKHNETITISGLKTGQTYSFSETVPSGYQASINGGTAVQAPGTAESGIKAVAATGNANTIVNSSSSNVPTGLIKKYLPYVILLIVVVAAIIGIVVVSVKNKKQDTEK